MTKKRYITILTLTFCLTTTLFIAVVAQPPGTPELLPTPKPFSTSTDVLILRGTKATSGDDTVYYLLVDEDTPYPSQNWHPSTSPGYGHYCSREDVEIVDTNVAGFLEKIYDETFIYERNPPEGYIISGMPTVSLTFNVSSGFEEPTYTLAFYADLYKYLVFEPEISLTKIVDLGDYARTYKPVGTHPPSDWQSNIWFAYNLHDPIYIASHERLALRVQVWGSCLNMAGADIHLEFLHTLNTDEFLVNIPIQYEG